MPIFYSLIIPIYNGAPYLRATFDELASYYTGRTDIDIILIDDGSVDDTKKIIERLIKEHETALPHVRLVSYSNNKGKGYAVQRGFSEASPESSYITFTDVELPYGLAKIEEAVEYLCMHENIGMVIGDRTQAEKGRKQYATSRKLMNKCFRLLIPRALRHINDTQSGMKVFRRDTLRLLFSRVKTARWVFDLELFLIAIHHAVGIHQLPVTIKPACVTRGGVTIAAHACQILRDIFLIYYYDLRGAYKKDRAA